MEYLEDKTATGPLEDGLYRFKCIKDHKGPYTSSDRQHDIITLTKTSPNLRLDPPKGEDQPQDLTSDVFVYAGPILMDLITPTHVHHQF